MLRKKDDVAISVKNVTKHFKIPLEHTAMLKQKVVGLFTRKKGYREFTPLQDISFEIKKGEFFGIVGRNGSGKSTLLKTIAGIYTPNGGSVDVNGTLVPFIELGVGFNPELSGRENVFLNGALLGFSSKEMAAMYGDIVDFAELHDFMEEKLKNYSSGMQVRLAFSVAIRAKTDILLLDEILAVGDEAFQKKCINYFQSLKKTGQTVVLVTHDMTNVERFCDRVLVLHKGGVVGILKPARAKIAYEQLNRKEEKTSEVKIEKRWGNKEVEIVEVEMSDAARSTTISQGDNAYFRVVTKSKKTKPIIVGFAICDRDGNVIAGPNSENENIKSNTSVVYMIPKINLVPGEYTLRVAIFAKDHKTEFDHLEEASNFVVVSNKSPQYGRINPLGTWGVENE